MKTVCEILMRAPTSAALQYYVCLGVPEQAAQLRSRREDRRKPVAVIRSAKLVAVFKAAKFRSELTCVGS